MKNTSVIVTIASVAVLGVAGGYWWGTRAHGDARAGATTATAAAAAAAPKERKLLYYRNPMGLPDTSPTPKKDPMGMDYIAVYEGEAAEVAAAGPGTLRISADKVQKLGVRTEAAAMRPLGRLVRASGRVEPDERRIVAITPKFEGYVERLHVNVSGQAVSQGQPLFEVYSPELVSAQREYAIAAQGAASLTGESARGLQQLAEASLLRLRNWDMPKEQIAALAAGAEPRRTVTFRSPASGIVTEKKALQGMRFMPGETLYTVTDLGAVWVIADIPEQDLGQVKTGATARLVITAYPERTFTGRVTYVYPTLNGNTRTVPVRIEMPNPGQLLKPAMFAQVELSTGGRDPVLTVPESAVIDSGTRRIVLVQLAEGRFEPREVKLGARGDAYVQVLDGVRAGEAVVTSANFLIDAESNLQAAVRGFGSPGGTGDASKAVPAEAAKAAPSEPSRAGVGHVAQGRIETIDAKAGSLSIDHGPVASLKWPAMTMDFKVANSALLDGLKSGASVRFEFVERQPGEWVITSIAADGHDHARR